MNNIPQFLNKFETISININEKFIKRYNKSEDDNKVVFGYKDTNLY